jgi:hypothetical protein
MSSGLNDFEKLKNPFLWFFTFGDPSSVIQVVQRAKLERLLYLLI